MKTYLITGAAGFIGANFIKYMLAKYPEIKIVVLDLLTYAGNLGTIAEDIDGERCEFVKGNICDRALTDELFAKYQFDYVVNFAAESHVDRSIENPQLFLVTNILGTQNLLDSARKAWVTGKAATGYPEWREVSVSTKCLPMRCMVAWGPKAISMKRLHWTHVVRTVHPRRVPTCLYKLTPKLIRCRSASPVVPTIMVRTISRKS